MKTVWNSLVAAFTMYSKIPMPNVNLTEENTKYSLCFFPLVGVVIGAILCGWRIAYPYLCNGDFLPAVVFVIVPVIISRGTHVGGFIHTVDAMCAPRTMEKKLEILKDTHTGSFAIIITLAYFLIALGVWSEMSINAVPMLAVGFVLSRALCGLSIMTFPYAKTSKLHDVFKDKKQKQVYNKDIIKMEDKMKTNINEMKNEYRANAENYKNAINAWSNVKRTTKKDGSDFANFGKNFVNATIRQKYSWCNPTLEVGYRCGNGYYTYDTIEIEKNDTVNDIFVKIFACFEQDKIVGIMVVSFKEQKNIEIIGIAVDVSARGKGIGSYMINQVINNYGLLSVYAETDNDAVGFYRKNGFNIMEFSETYDGATVVRYKCELTK